ncbi:ATP-binding cassette domain-containing protein [Pedobacter sp. HMF7647]|uniref:ATP-binding cassette domain-containing protein n=1 Tax=Hufsiella arboris TaxID=2695275 RepID=A0A7K1YA75_9SPHI|nr:ABC transporter ATP-binding protein [Hufsiella arboris]MXV51487.1 ATP-binding cassette domain-containing protein [Hufsiella arboris]
MITVSNLTFGYKKGRPLFENLSLYLEEGHIYGLLGKNGAGKSTLLKNLAGLVFPQEGELDVNGHNPSQRRPSFLSQLFFIPEELFMPAITVRGYVKNTAHFYPQFDREQFENILLEFNVPADQVMSRLSFGQQKKVMIAFGLASNTSLLIMDEPTNGLDIPSKVQFRKIIASALTEDRCIIISTHQVRDLDSLIDQVIVLHEREILLNKSLDEISDKLLFLTSSEANGRNVVYAEENMIGTNTIAENLYQKFSRVDMELLFNAIINNHKPLTEILNR